MKYVVKQGNRYMGAITILNTPENPNGHGASISVGCFDTPKQAHEAALAAKEAIKDLTTHAEQRAVIEEMRHVNRCLQKPFVLSAEDTMDFAEEVASALEGHNNSQDRAKVVISIINLWKIHKGKF